MKRLLCLCFLLITSSTFAKQVKDLNKALMEDVRKDVRTDNDLEFRPSAKKPVSRGPASVSPAWTGPEIDPGLKKNHVNGSGKW